jgi:transcription-repair coupling factor (superfamily II helicase)
LAQDFQVPSAGSLFDRVSRTPAVQSLARRLERGGLLSCAGVNPAAQPFFAALLHRLFPTRHIVVVTDNLKTQELFQEEMGAWLRAAFGGHSAFTPLFYPAWENLPHEGKLPHADVISERLETLVALSPDGEARTPRPRLIVTTVAALLQKTFPPESLRADIRRLARGDTGNPLDLVEWLEARGYEPEAQVTQKGEIALRGGILDVFPPTHPWPVRLEFFGNELESLRAFDPLTQISRAEIPGVTLPPAGELGLLKRGLERRTDPVPPPGIPAAEGTDASATLATLLDHLPRETTFLLCEPELLALRANEYARAVPGQDPFFAPWERILDDLDSRGMTRLAISEAPETVQTWRTEADSASGASASREALSSPGPLFNSLEAFRPIGRRAADPQIAEAQRREFFAQIHRWLRLDYSVHVFCNNEGERQRFGEIWAEQGLGDCPPLNLGALGRGFLCDEAKSVVVTDAEIFGRYHVQRARRLKSPHAAAMRSALEIDFADLEAGDLVVHLQHGIGRYLGLSNLPATAGRSKAGIQHPDSVTECLLIEYAPASDDSDPPRLYVPVTEAHLVSKYVGAGKASPPLNTLGGTRWRKAKEQAERAVRDVAAELLQIQAARASQPGHAFASDTPWQREFESAFIFEETQDQIKAIADTKNDMERAKPMDRLICGDVGFGKTEVAIRAAFKAVMGGRQVAVLVPTTVLAQQHFNTFVERMADYPVRIELLSRFRTRREQQRVAANLACGAVDIAIGTHRLIQDDIAFKDLGLVVIDEEQRFGVLHKEKFKRLRTMVDVLTLSATPIPRTLYLALTGARDLSSIQTPPHDRLPVETIVIEYDERTIRDAIQREMNRAGQVFFLHNRVATIETVADRLRKLLPRARIVVGHGQLPADELEEVMTRFINGEADVLLSTTIIESGLDIPNANTIIIDRADRFGLSDLYQLRGRVGRYKHQAFAYLLLPRHARLLTDVRKRISAMKQYSTLGSGFKIAMRDLEIRGAGNLLGAEQSGHITAVGFELYCQLLKQSVSALKGETVKPRMDVRIALDFLETNAVIPETVRGRAVDAPFHGLHERPPHPTSLPHNYVPEPQHRIEIYRKLAQATDKAALDSLRSELRDRFGPIPPPVEMLLAVAELKHLAAARNVTDLEVREDRLMLTRQGDFITLGGRFPRLAKKEAGARVREIKKLLLAI